MRFLATGDNHFKEGARFAECVRIHEWFAQEIEKEKPDAIFYGGDIYDAASTPTERRAVSEHLVRVAEIAPVLLVRGNHDREKDCEILGRLRSKHKITVEETCGVHVIGGIAVAAVAWPKLGSLAALFQVPTNSDRLNLAGRSELGRVLLGLGSLLDEYPGLPRITLGHFMADGAMTSLGQPLIGSQMNVPLSDLALVRSQMTVMSHIHKPQEWLYDGCPIVYCGSPYATAFGETEQKSVVLADITPSGLSWTRLATPRTPMILLEDEWGAEGWRAGAHGLGYVNGQPNEKGAEVRFRYRVSADQRDAAKEHAAEFKQRLLDQGALSVKVEEVVNATVRARVPEITTAPSLAEKVKIVLKARHISLSAEREARLLAKLSLIEKAG